MISQSGHLLQRHKSSLNHVLQLLNLKQNETIVGIKCFKQVFWYKLYVNLCWQLMILMKTWQLIYTDNNKALSTFDYYPPV